MLTRTPVGIFFNLCSPRVLGYALALGLIGAMSSGLLLPPPAAAQDGDVITEDEEDAQAQQAPAANTNNGEEQSGDQTDNATQAGKRMSYLEWAAKSLGIFYSFVFLSLSFVLVALFVMNLLAARRENVVPVTLIEEFEGLLEQKKYQEAYDLARADESMLGQVVSAGLAKVSSGYDKAIEAMQEVAEEESMKHEHRLSYLALIGTISPMIGLLGTVQGMIGAFNTLATTSSGAPDARELAGDISTALFTTLCGLFIAIPAIAAYNILRNRITRLVLEVGIVSESLMSRFQSVGVKKNP